MDILTLEKSLFELDDYEHFASTLTEEFQIPFIIEDNFFKPDQNVDIFKHPRYIRFPEHRHSFIEINYVYSGSCRQFINGKEVILKEGDLCLLDTNVVHSIEKCSDNDIIINIMIRNSYFDSALLHRLSGNDLLTDFFVNAIYEQKKDSRYIVFRKDPNNGLKDLINRTLWEFYYPQLCSFEAINSYLLLIFTELLRNYHKTNKKEKPVLKKAVLSDILKFMEQNYQTITLEKTAEKFHFHPNYLTRILKNHFGKTFIELSHQLKNRNACTLLENTDFTIEQIAKEIGYSNVAFFYKSFKKYQGVTPTEYRKNKEIFTR